MTIRNSILLLLALHFFGCTPNQNPPTKSPSNQGSVEEDPNWAYYLGDKESSQFKFFDQINAQNAKELEVAWTYSSGLQDKQQTQVQTNPLIIDGVLYGVSPVLHLFALDAATGKELWRYDPSDGREFKDAYQSGVARGLVYHEHDGIPTIMFSPGHHLISVNAQTGQAIESFGQGGMVDLKEGYDKDYSHLYMTANTPGVIYKDLYILGNRVSESLGAIPGHLRAFDLKTGAIRWTFHTIPKHGEYGYETWPKDAFKNSGGANTWAGLSLDEERGIVYVPTGSASFDFYGGDRIGENLFANCIVALNAATGERIWHYQTVHHDIWDKDLPAPPNLMTIKVEGKDVDVVTQISKSGYLYVLDRETGKPIHPIDEKPMPPSSLEGEEAWPTQPIPTVFPPFSKVDRTEADLAIRNPLAKQYAQGLWNTSLKGQQFIPMDTIPQITFPGLDGGGEWGGAAHGKDNHTLYVNSSEQPWLLQVEKIANAPLGRQVFTTRCVHCHGASLEGNEMFGNVPSLINLKDRSPRTTIETTIKNGRGLMPAFNLKDDQLTAVIDYILGEEDPSDVVAADANWPYPYRFTGYQKAMAPDGYSIFQPPWGQLTAIDMDNAKIKWQVPLGNIDALNIPDHPITGTENYGGPVVTSGGVIFIAATQDEKFRVFDRETGEQLFEYELPAAGYATPATYMVDGKQYVVIACGGGKLGTNSGDVYVAFGL